MAATHIQSALDVLGLLNSQLVCPTHNFSACIHLQDYACLCACVHVVSCVQYKGPE